MFAHRWRMLLHFACFHYSFSSISAVVSSCFAPQKHIPAFAYKTLLGMSCGQDAQHACGI